jgi:hypothetical protein
MQLHFGNMKMVLFKFCFVVKCLAKIGMEKRETHPPFSHYIHFFERNK